MYGGFKKWVVDRYFVGSLYRNGFRVMWFPALVYYVCRSFLIKSVAITCVFMITLLTTSFTFQIEMIKHKLSIIIVKIRLSVYNCYYLIYKCNHFLWIRSMPSLPSFSPMPYIYWLNPREVLRKYSLLWCSWHSLNVECLISYHLL